jgi:hypothetical protein
MSRNSTFGPGEVALFAIVCFVGAASALKLIGPDSPTHDATTTSGSIQADLMIWPLLIGLPMAGAVALLGWWYYA